MAFDPKAYLAKQSSDQSGFDPKAYLAKNAAPEEDVPWYQVENPTARGLVSGTLKSLPGVGGLLGGLVATPADVAAGPFGTMAGAGLGAAGGKALQNIGEKYLLGEDVDRSKLFTSPVKEGLDFAAAEGAGQTLGEVLPKAAKLITPEGLKQNASEISAASEKLGFKPTEGMISESPYVQKLESSLEQSPSIPGAMVRQETKQVRKGLSDAAKNVFDEVSYAQPSDVGSSVKKGLLETIQARLEPITQKFEDIRGSTGFIDVSPKSKELVARNIENIDTLKSSPGSSLVKSIAEDLRNVKNADDLKVLRTNLMSRMRKPGIDPAEYSALGKAADKIQSLETNSIMRSAIQGAAEGASKNEFSQLASADEGREIAKGLIKDLKGARKDFRGLMSEISDIGEGSGVDKNFKNLPNFLDKLESIPDEKIVDSLWKTNNRNYLNKLKDFDFDQFDKLRVAKLQNIQRASEIKGEVDPVKFLKNVRSIEPDTRTLLFGPDANEKIQAMETVVNSLPDKVGPSGTPSGMEWQHMLDPSFWFQQIPRTAQYGLYKKSGLLRNAGEALQTPGIGTQKAFYPLTVKGRNE